MRKSELQGPLPGEDETEAWLRAHEFKGILQHHIPLTLAGLVLHLLPGKDLVARKWCILAIWSSEGRGLTTEGIFKALIKAVKKFSDDADAVTPKGKSNKPTGWAVSASASACHCA